MGTKNADRNAEIMRLFMAGETYGDIGKAMGITRLVVSGVIYRNRTTQPDPVKASYRQVNAE